MLALVSLESLVPLKHPLRRMKPLVDGVLARLSATFDAMYSSTGRPSVPPERLLKGMVLMALYGLRSERLFCEQLGYNMLFRWFLEMDMLDKAFDATAFTHNRERLMRHDVAGLFLSEVVEVARRQDLLSSEHFSVDGTLIEAWASMKSFRPKDEDGGDNNGYGDFTGQSRGNDTHESKTDPEARLTRKGRGKEAKLAYMGHALMENRNGLLLDFELTQANGYAERDGAIKMLTREQARRAGTKKRGGKGLRATVAADRGYDAREFVRRCRDLGITPHIARKRRSSAIDGRTTRHPGYAMSTKARRLIEKIFGWMKSAAAFRRTRFRGQNKTAFTAKLVAATYNALRITRLSNPVSP